MQTKRLGLLDSTLVAVTTEFGRNPGFDGSGRGHHQISFSIVLAGGGVKRGSVYGASDAKGYEVFFCLMAASAAR